MDTAILGRERTKLQVAHFKLSHSRACILRAYPLQTHEMLFDAHEHAFRVLGGVPQRGIYDNSSRALPRDTKTAMDRVGTGKSRQVNARFSAMGTRQFQDRVVRDPGWRLGRLLDGGLRRSGYRTQILFHAPCFRIPGETSYSDRGCGAWRA